MGMKRKWLGMIAFLLVLFYILMLGGCSSQDNRSDYTGSKQETDTEGNGYNNDSADTVSADSEVKLLRKIIFTASLQVETLQYDESIADFEKLVNDSSGYIQDSRVEASSGINGSVKLRTARYTVRIPSDKLSAFRTSVGDIGTITLNEVSGDDVTDQYYDSQSRLNALKVQETRLLALLGEAANLSEILELEDRLATIRYEIESLTGTLAKLDSLVDMSTVDVTIQEVEALTEPTPDSFFAKVSSIFKESLKALVNTLQGITYVIVALFPFLAVLAIIAGIVILIVRATQKRSAAKVAKYNATYNPPADPDKK